MWVFLAVLGGPATSSRDDRLADHLLIGLSRLRHASPCSISTSPTTRCGERRDQGEGDEEPGQFHVHLQSHMPNYGREAQLDVGEYRNPNRLSFRREH